MITSKSKILYVIAALLGLATIPAFSTEIPEILLAERTITDKKGQMINGTILTKTSDSITFQRATDNSHFEIKLVSLSLADQQFILKLNAGEAIPLQTAPQSTQSIVEPGKRVILALPFQEQDRAGICAGKRIFFR